MTLGACVSHTGQRHSDDLQAISINTYFFLLQKPHDNYFL